MKKTVIILLCLFTLICPLFAQDVSTLLSKAKLNGTAFRTVENAYQSSKNISLSGPEKISVQVSQSEPIDKFFKDVPDASITVVFPELGEDLLMDMKLDSTTKNGVYSLNPTVNVSKTFDLSEEGINGAANLADEIKVELNYQKNMLDAENTFYSTVSSIMSSENSLKTEEKNLERSLADYENSIATGQIKPGSVNDLKNQQTLESLKSNYKSSKLRLEQSKKNFKTNYGIEYEAITQAPSYDLTFDPSMQTNTDLYISYLNYLVAKKTYLQSIGEGSTLEVSGSIGGPTKFSNGKFDSKDWTVGAEADLALENFKASFSIKDTINKNNTLELMGKASVKMGDFNVDVGLSQTFASKSKTSAKPVLTVSGTWSDSAGSDATLKNALIAYNNSQTSYENAVLSFNISVQNMVNDIASFNSRVEQFNIRKSFNQSILEYQTKLYELGYISQRDYQDALDAVEKDKLDEVILALDGLKLENNIKKFCL